MSFLCGIYFFNFLGSCTILIDRIYLGVHSPADVVAGGLLGVCLLAVYRFLHLDMLIDDLIMNSSSKFM